MVQAGVFRNVAMEGIHPCSNSGESNMPLQEARLIQLSPARPVSVVIGQHKPRKQNEKADRGKACIDYRREEAKPLGIGKMKEDNVDGREGAQACKCIQPGWLLDLHALLDVSVRAGTKVQGSGFRKTRSGQRAVSCRLDMDLFPVHCSLFPASTP